MYCSISTIIDEFIDIDAHINKEKNYTLKIGTMYLFLTKEKFQELKNKLDNIQEEEHE